MYNSNDKSDIRLGASFLRFFMGRNLVRLSSIMFYIYYMWILIVKYNSVFLVSLIPTLSLAGYLLVLLPEGYMLDRLPRDKVMFASSIAITLSYLSLLFSHALLWIYIVAMLSSIFSNISSDAFFTLMKDLVNAPSMGKGMSLIEAGRGFSEVSGIALGGLSIILFPGKFVPLIVLISVASVALSVPKIKVGKGSAAATYRFSHVLKAIKIIMPFLLIGLLINGLFVSLEVYASGLFYSVLRAGPAYYTLFGLDFPVGGLIGGLIGVRISKRLENPLFVASAIAFFGLAFFVLSVSRVPLIDVIVMLPLGAVNSLANIPLMSYMVKVIPNEALGRVNSVTTVFMAGASPVMAVVYGLLSRVFPIPTVLLLIAFLLAVSSVPTYFSLKGLFTLTEEKVKEAMTG